ncbi:MAG: right-handed parallel beta-helix repeat-containing protein [Thermoplasmatota archaeon]
MPSTARAVLAALLALASTLAPLPPESGGEPPPFGIGDWVVTGEERLEREVLVLDGNLTIESGGSLTLENSTLFVLCHSPAERSVVVEGGGHLSVLNSTIASFDPIYRPWFFVEPSATALFESSSFIGIGEVWVPPGEPYYDLDPINTGNGGVCIKTDGAAIRNCTFSGADYGLVVLGVRPEVRGCTFSMNTAGLVLNRASPEVLNCTFDRNFYGALLHGASPLIGGCTFTGNGQGMMLDGSDPTVRDCLFLNQSGNGILCAFWMGIAWTLGESNPVVANCSFVRNRCGITSVEEDAPTHPHHSLTLENSMFEANSHGGLLWSERCQRPPPERRTTWTVTGEAHVREEGALRFNGTVLVQTGGSMLVENSTINLDGGWDGECGIEVASGGALILENSALRAQNASHAYSLRCRPGSELKMDGSLLRDCGWSAGALESSGPLLETNDASINRSVLDYNTVGLVLRTARGARIEGSYVRGLDTGLSLHASTARLSNSTLRSVGRLQGRLDGASLLDCLNTSLNRSLFEFSDELSRLNVSWLLDARAVWQDGSPVAGAELVARDSEGREVLRTFSGEDGWARGGVLTEAFVTRDSATILTPHRLRFSKGSISNESEVNATLSLSIQLVLSDREPPGVSLTSPAPNASLNRTEVEVRGEAWDNLGVRRVELSVDGYRRFVVHEAEGEGLPRVQWGVGVELIEGAHTLEAIAQDASGNTASAAATVFIDSTPPTVRVASPQSGYLTNSSLLEVWGFCEPGSRVFLGELEAAVERNIFRASVLLSEGENTITAVALDSAGNKNSSSVAVRLDTTAPYLEVDHPEDGLRTRTPMVEVSGRMETGADVLINGRRVALLGEPGTFRTAIALLSELSVISIEAVDPAGNSRALVRRVYLDTRPPALEVLSPPEGLVTNRPLLTVSGFCEGGARLLIGTRESLIPGKEGERVEFSLPVFLTEGETALEVRALDPAGNSNATTRHVVLDTSPPELVVESPENGSSTRFGHVYIVGRTEPGARVHIGSEEAPVGTGGAFTHELRLGTGTNRVVLRATDQAGNSRELELTVVRLAEGAGDEAAPPPGPDWLFVTFLAASVSVMISEGYIAGRGLRARGGRRRAGAGPRDGGRQPSGGASANPGEGEGDG